MPRKKVVKKRTSWSPKYGSIGETLVAVEDGRRALESVKEDDPWVAAAAEESPSALRILLARRQAEWDVKAHQAAKVYNGKLRKLKEAEGRALLDDAPGDDDELALDAVVEERYAYYALQRAERLSKRYDRAAARVLSNASGESVKEAQQAYRAELQRRGGIGKPALATG